MKALQKEMNVLCAYSGMHIKGGLRLGDRSLQTKQALEIIFKCPKYLSLQILWESGCYHSSAVITPPWSPGKRALSTSLQTEHPLHGTHRVTWHLSGSDLAPSLSCINTFPGRAPHCSGVLCWGGHPTLCHCTATSAHCCCCQMFA